VHEAKASQVLLEQVSLRKVRVYHSIVTHHLPLFFPEAERYLQASRAAKAATINRELAWLKHMFTLATRAVKLMTRPHIALLQENNARQGFFEPEQYASVLRHLPDDLRPVVTFAYITGWRAKSEVLTREWRHVDFAAGEVRLEPGTTKNKEGRTFPFTRELRALLEAQHTERERLKKRGIVVPWVFWRMVADERGARRNRARSRRSARRSPARADARGVRSASSTTCAARPSGTSNARESAVERLDAIAR
jgi:hypothetical protein